MQIITAKDQWTTVSKTTQARIWNGRVYRKDFHPAYFGGYQVKYVAMDSRLGREWLADFGHTTASCSKEVAEMIDPSGELRRAGLLFVA